MESINLLDIFVNTHMLKNGLSVCCMTAKDIANALLLYFQGDKSKWFDIGNCEGLVIKDIDYLIGKTATQEEFSKLIQARSKSGTHTIIETNCAIKELTFLSKYLLDNTKFLLL